jgi:hypothetical protein
MLLAEASRELAGAPFSYSEQALATILSPRHFVGIRTTYGGPAPASTARAAESSRALLEEDQRWLSAATGAIAEAERRLEERSATL